MKKTNKKNKLKEYDERHHYWRDKVFSQLGFSINFFITFGIAFLIYLIEKRSCYKELNTNSIIFFLSLLLIFISIYFGSLAILSRLFDLRITSRKLKTRKKCLKKLGRKLPDDFPEKNNVNLLKDFCNLLLKKFEGLSDNDYKDYETVKSKFLYWRQLTQKLGRLTWRSHKRQIIFFYISILLFGINIVIK